MKKIYKQVLLIFLIIMGSIIFGYVISIGMDPSNFTLKGLEDALMSQLEKFKIPL